MNARSHTFKFYIEECQIKEVVTSLLHTLLFQRVQGKRVYADDGGYKIGSVGMVDVDCNSFDCTYVRTASDELEQRLSKEVAEFHHLLRHTDGGSNCGQIELEFFQKKRTPFSCVGLLAPECIAWEIWVIQVEVIKCGSITESEIHRERLNGIIDDKIMYIAEAMSRHEYVPLLPTLQADLELVFDINYSNIQPYCFRIRSETAASMFTEFSNAMCKLVKDTLAI